MLVVVTDSYIAAAAISVEITDIGKRTLTNPETMRPETIEPVRGVEIVRHNVFATAIELDDPMVFPGEGEVLDRKSTRLNSSH